MTQPSGWTGLLDTCINRVAAHWPSPPAHVRSQKPASSTESAVFLYSGNIHETASKRLLLENRLTPLECNAWQVFRLLLDKESFAVSRYKDLQPYLSMTPTWSTGF